MKKILLAGDSWGYAAGYDDQPGFILTADAFPEYDFTNVSERGGLNSKSIQFIKDGLNNIDYDTIFWIQTDPMRDLRLEFLEWDEGHGAGKCISLSEYGVEICSTVNLVRFIENLITDSYSRLNTIAGDANKKIHCLGGCSMLHPSISLFPNLIPIIPSIVQFLVPTFTEDTFIYDTNWLHLMILYADSHAVNKTFSDNLRAVVDLSHPKESKIFGYVPHFSLDSHHPDPEGLLLWAAECKKYI